MRPQQFVRLYLLFHLFLVLCVQETYGQVNVRGTVVDSSNQAIEFATVVLIDSLTSRIKTGVITNKEGNFHLESKSEGAFKLRVSYIGYKDWNGEVFKTKDFGTITLNNSSNELTEIMVTSKKPLIERKVDRLVFNVGNSVVSKGVDAIEVLRRTPKIDVTQGSIQLIGKSSLKVMINNRILKLSNSDLEAYLRTIRSENIDKIEVITTPPSKYDAEGNSGLINIKVKKNADHGWKGSVNSTCVQRTYAAYMASANVNYSSEKFHFGLNIFGDTEDKASNSSLKVDFVDNYRNTERKRKDSSEGGSAGVDLEYKLNSKSDIGLFYNINTWETMQKSRNLSHYITKQDNVLDSTLNSPSDNVNSYDFHTITSVYNIQLDTLGKKIQVNASYLYKDNNDKRQFITTTSIPHLDSPINENSAIDKTSANYEVLSMGSDVSLPFSNYSMEFGGKIDFIKNNSKIRYYDTSNGNPVVDQGKSNDFDYEERISALYFSLSKQLGDKWDAQLGLRFENTYTKGNSITLNQEFTKHFNNLFPSIYLTYKHNSNNSFSISYSKRIERPGFYSVNPFRVYSDIYSYDAGNPELQPSFTHNMEFSFLYKNRLSCTLYGSRLIDGVDYITLSTPNSNAIVSRPENYYDQNTLGLDLSFSIDPVKWFNSYNSTSLYYNNSKSNMGTVTLPEFDGYGCYISTKNTFTLNRINTSFLELNFFQSLPNKEGFIKSYNRASLDIGYRQSFLKDNLHLGVSIRDIFAQNHNKIKETYQTYDYYSRIYNDIRSLTISISYNFGNNKVKSLNNSISNSNKTRL